MLDPRPSSEDAALPAGPCASSSEESGRDVTLHSLGILYMSCSLPMFVVCLLHGPLKF
jgi:hypothetical protein